MKDRSRAIRCRVTRTGGGSRGSPYELTLTDVHKDDRAHLLRRIAAKKRGRHAQTVEVFVVDEGNGA